MAGGGGRRSEGNLWGEVGETVVSYIFVRYFCSPYKRVDFARSSLVSLPLQLPRGAPALSRPPRETPAATCRRPPSCVPAARR